MMCEERIKAGKKMMEFLGSLCREQYMEYPLWCAFKSNRYGIVELIDEFNNAMRELVHKLDASFWTKSQSFSIKEITTIPEGNHPLLAAARQVLEAEMWRIIYNALQFVKPKGVRLQLYVHLTNKDRKLNLEVRVEPRWEGEEAE